MPLTFTFFPYLNNGLDSYKMLSPDEWVKVLRFLKIHFKYLHFSMNAVLKLNKSKQCLCEYHTDRQHM